MFVWNFTIKFPEDHGNKHIFLYWYLRAFVSLASCTNCIMNYSIYTEKTQSGRRMGVLCYSILNIRNFSTINDENCQYVALQFSLFFFFGWKKEEKNLESNDIHCLFLIQDIKFFVANKRDKYSNNNNKNNYVRLLYWNICTKKILEVFTFGMQISTKNKTDWNDLSFYHSLWFQFQIAFQRGFFIN